MPTMGETTCTDFPTANIAHQKINANNIKIEGFVPPPIHTVMDHVSAHAASYLLRMGADPRVRPKLDEDNFFGKESTGKYAHYHK